jgi:hypothetical protein
MMTTEAQFDPIGKARERGRLLELIPDPTGPVYDADARTALIRAGVSEANMILLDEANRRPPVHLTHRR